ncbi:Uncharacterized protein TCM_014928 [Theobroma cacao]|uniref:Uncharacterized protein n=1 Tax=Theobroma cacao TaxID=3641 RepID=A0A061FZC2_THECC|nr:Uncharacterized protein TCM_014928 [Theobroma cacao]
MTIMPYECILVFRQSSDLPDASRSQFIFRKHPNPKIQPKPPRSLTLNPRNPIPLLPNFSSSATISLLHGNNKKQFFVHRRHGLRNLHCPELQRSQHQKAG